MALLEINNLEYSYGQVKAVKGISMHVNEGEIVTLIGSNGAGKTTLRTVSGLVSPQGVRGEILFDGQPIQKNPGYKIARLGLYQVLESRHVFPKLTIEENLATVRITSVTASRSKTASARSTVCSRGWRNARPPSAATCRAASSRCWQSAARSSTGQSS